MRDNDKDRYTNQSGDGSFDEPDELSYGFLEMTEKDAGKERRRKETGSEGKSTGKRTPNTGTAQRPRTQNTGTGRIKQSDSYKRGADTGTKNARVERNDEKDSSKNKDIGDDSLAIDAFTGTGYYEQIRRNAEAKQRDEKRKNRKRERLKAVRRAKALLVLAAAAAVFVIVLAVRLVSRRTTLFSETSAEAEAAETDALAAVGAGTIGTSDFLTTGSAEEAADEGPVLPDEAQIEADRAAKNYSEDVASFWPYYWWYEDKDTQLIPCEAAFRELGIISDTAEDTSSQNAEESSKAASVTESTGESARESTAKEVSTVPDTKSTEESTGNNTSDTASTEETEETAKTDPYIIGDGDDTFTSQYGVLVNVDTGQIVAKKNPYAKIVPASMTKVMTLLVAVEAMTDPESQMQQMVTLTQADEEYAYVNDSSAVCWMPGDTATVEDLMYGTILPSGADAAVALAEYTSGSMEEFVKLMNAKLEDLGLTDTHFTNCVGVYDENHYSTPCDIAVIMKAAMENDICRKVLSAHTWTTSPTSQHPEGITVSNWFLRRIEDFDNHGTVLCAKTGFVSQSGYCGVSYQISNDGTHYILCSADTFSSWKCIYDHTAIYQEYTN